MEFLTSAQKKKKARRLYTGYALLAVLVSLATYVLISTALGFEVFSTKGEVVQNGLLFIDTRPDNAEVYLNGKKESNNTNVKLTIPEGAYDIVLKKQNYRDWAGSVALMGGTVEFLTYPRLYPTEPEVLYTRTLSSVPISSQSRDKRFIARFFLDQPTSIEIQDLSNPNDPVLTIPIPVTVSENLPIISAEFGEWAGDNEHFIVAFSLGGSAPRTVHATFHRAKPEEVVNVTSLFSLPSDTDVGFWDAKRDIVYIHNKTSGTLQIGNLKEKSLQAQALFSDPAIEFFPIGKERAIYTTMIGEEKFVRFYSDNKTFTITTAPNKDKEVIAKLFGFNRNEYIYIGGEALDKPLLFRNFEKAIADSSTGRVAPFVTMPIYGKYVDVSRSNRFIMGSDGATVAVYDLEEKELVRYVLTSKNPTLLAWLDDVRLYARGEDATLSIFDFDGGNNYAIASNFVASAPLLNSSVSRLELIRSTDTGTVLSVLDVD